MSKQQTAYTVEVVGTPNAERFFTTLARLLTGRDVELVSMTKSTELSKVSDKNVTHALDK